MSLGAMTMVPLEWYLILAAALFCVGAYGVMSRRNTVAMLMGIELMLCAVGVNLVAFWRYREPTAVTGQAFALFVYAVAAIETAVCLALTIALWHTRNTVLMEDAD
jgi:NADH-quinone oxidoreductase subunit K